MKKRFFDLQLFTDGGGTGAGGGAGAASGGDAAGGGSGSGGQANAGGGSGSATYSYEQTEQIATARAENASRAALAKVKEMENTNYLRDKGVKADDLDYVLFKASRQVDDKTDFKKAADAYLKENPRFTGKGYRVVSTGTPDGGSGNGQTVRDSINASIRSAFGR